MNGNQKAIPTDLYIVLANWPNRSLCSKLCYPDNCTVCFKLVLCIVQSVHVVCDHSYRLNYILSEVEISMRVNRDLILKFDGNKNESWALVWKFLHGNGNQQNPRAVMLSWLGHRLGGGNLQGTFHMGYIWIHIPDYKSIFM